MRGARDAIAIGIGLLATAPLVSAMRSVALEEWMSYLLYMIVGLGFLGAAWSWHKTLATGVRLGLGAAAVGLLARTASGLGGPVDAYVIAFALWTVGCVAGAAWAARRVEAGTALVVGVSGAVYTFHLGLLLRDGLLFPTILAGDVLGIAGALVALWAWRQRAPTRAQAA